MANLDVWYSSKTDNWTTPQDFFEELNQEFDFNLDPCASDENHKCKRYFTKENDGLSQNWGGAESSAIRLMAARLASGLKSVMRKDTKKTQSLSP